MTHEKAKTAGQRLEAVLRRFLTPLLKQRGFRKRGKRYHADLPELLWLVDATCSVTTAPEFTVDVGVLIPAVFEVYFGRAAPRNPGSADCTVSARIGLLSAERLDKWWTLSCDADEKVAGEDLRAVMEAVGLPFLDQFTSRVSVAKFLTEPGHDLVDPRAPTIRLTFAAIIYGLAGDAAASAACLLEAEHAADPSIYPGHIDAVRQRIESKKA
jgi:hypothetical protein